MIEHIITNKSINVMSFSTESAFAEARRILSNCQYNKLSHLFIVEMISEEGFNCGLYIDTERKSFIFTVTDSKDISYISVHYENEEGLYSTIPVRKLFCKMSGIDDKLENIPRKNGLVDTVSDTFFTNKASLDYLNFSATLATILSDETDEWSYSKLAETLKKKMTA